MTSQDVQESFDESLKLNPQSSLVSGQKRYNEESGHANISQKRTRGQTREDLETRESGPCSTSIIPGFLTPGSKLKENVSENALNSASRCPSSSTAAFSDEEDTIRDDSVTTPDRCFIGFVTAGTNKVITISDSALEAAKRRLHSVMDDSVPSSSKETDVENLDPSQFSVTSSTKRSTPIGPNLEVTPVTRRSSRDRFNTALPHSVAIKLSDSVGSNRRTTTKEGSITKGNDSMASRITCVRDLRNCQLTTVDFLGIVVESAMSCQEGLSGIPLLQVADRYGESVSIEVLSSSIPPNISLGCVISVDGALLRRTGGNVSLVINDSTFVDLEPNDPEAKCLHRLFLTGLFDSGLSEDLFAFEHSTLRVIGRLNEYPREVSTIMARICSMNSDSLVYLGCTSCKKSVTPISNGITSCHHCRNKKARYFYSLSMELADFTGVIVVNVSDEAAEKLIERPAGGIVKLEKNALKKRLLSLYFRPMLFRICEQNSLWFVDDWKQLDIPKFKPFLRKIAEQKGYK